MYKGSCFVTSLPAFVVVITIDSGLSNWGVVLIYISFITRESEHFFMYLLDIYTSSFENSLFNSCAYFFIEMLILWG
jgi:hypothetical protein